VRLSAVVPVLDEEPTLDELHRRLSAVLGSLAGEFEIVFVNDGSRDGSLARMKAIAGRDPRVVVVDLRRHSGKTAALAAGFAEAKGEILVTLDSDLQDVPEEIPKLVARINEGAEFVTGRKQGRRDPWTRRLASRVFNGVVSRVAGTRVRDVNSGLKAMTREVAAELPLHGEMHRFLPVFAGARGFRVVEVDVAHEPRRHGRSRYGWSRYAAGFFDSATVLLLTRYGTRPLHFFGCFGLLLSLVGGGALAYLVVGWIFGQWIGNRPLLLFGVLSVILGIQCVFFGLLAELVVVSNRRRVVGGVREVIRGKRAE
jgi:glycosyltransferase involved in cell wall biosynthesis